MHKRVSFLLIATSFAWTTEAATLEESVLQSPAVAAEFRRFEAAQHRLDASGRWADPELEGMYSERRMPNETNPMWEVNLTQPLPKAGERTADRERAMALRAMAEAEWLMSAGMVAAESASALAEWDAAQQRCALLQDQLEKTERVLSAVQTRLGAGQGGLNESLALQSRLTTLRLDLEKEQFMAGEAERMARQLLGLDAAASLPAFAAPEPERIDPASAPEMKRLAAQQDEARAMQAMARAEGRPMTAIGLRFEREEAGDGDEDTVGVALMTELPWNSRRSARAEASAAEAEYAATSAGTEVLQRRIEADRTRALRLNDLAERTRATVAENLQRLDREYDAWIESTGTAGSMDASSVLMLIDLLERRTMLHMQAIDADQADMAGRAVLWKYVPLNPGEYHE